MPLQKGEDNFGKCTIKKTPVFSFKKDSMRKGGEVNWRGRKRRRRKSAEMAQAKQEAEHGVTLP